MPRPSEGLSYMFYDTLVLHQFEETGPSTLVLLDLSIFTVLTHSALHLLSQKCLLQNNYLKDGCLGCNFDLLK